MCSPARRSRRTNRSCTKSCERFGVNAELVADLPFLQEEPATFAIQQAMLAQFLRIAARRRPQLSSSFPKTSW